MGYGFFAVCDIPKGVVVLSERALILPYPVPSTVATMHQMIGLAMTPRWRDRFMALSPPGDDYEKKYTHNAFWFGDRPAILFAGATFNHSCRPNVVFKRVGERMVFTTCEPVKRGQQLFDCYGQGCASAIDLLNRYEFVCKCGVC